MIWKQYRLLAVASAVSVILFIGCSDDSDPAVTAPNWLHGTWTDDSVGKFTIGENHVLRDDVEGLNPLDYVKQETVISNDSMFQFTTTDESVHTFTKNGDNIAYNLRLPHGDDVVMVPSADAPVTIEGSMIAKLILKFVWNKTVNHIKTNKASAVPSVEAGVEGIYFSTYAEKDDKGFCGVTFYPYVDENNSVTDFQSSQGRIFDTSNSELDSSQLEDTPVQVYLWAFTTKIDIVGGDVVTDIAFDKKHDTLSALRPNLAEVITVTTDGMLDGSFQTTRDKSPSPYHTATSVGDYPLGMATSNGYSYIGSQNDLLIERFKDNEDKKKITKIKSIVPKDFRIRDIDISPDGKTLVFIANNGKESRLETFSINTTSDKTAENPTLIKRITIASSYYNNVIIDSSFVYLPFGRNLELYSLDLKPLDTQLYNNLTPDSVQVPTEFNTSDADLAGNWLYVVDAVFSQDGVPQFLSMELVDEADRRKHGAAGINAVNTARVDGMDFVLTPVK